MIALYPLNAFAVNLAAPEDDGDTEEEQTECTYSGTIPVLFVTLDNPSDSITREGYLSATYYLDPMGTDCEAIGSAENPLPTQIKGRGNTTWTNSPKKPYKLKLGKKQSMLGLPKSKHWALLAYNGYASWTTNFLGLEFGRHLDFCWTPQMKPVELVLNGQYEGLYFLTETVRIESGRLDISEQADEETDPNVIPYGWLVEIDNYSDPCQVTIHSDVDKSFWVTYHTPEVLSKEQEKWLKDEFTKIYALINCEDKTCNDWENYIDAESLAKYFVVREVMDDTDGFLGSFYLHKDAGEDSKWVAGPLWDISCRGRDKTDFTVFMENWTGGQFTSKYHPVWIWELLKFPHFMELVHKVCDEYCTGDMTVYTQALEDFGTPLVAADAANFKRWPNNSEPNTKSKIRYASNWFLKDAEWLVNHMSNKVEGLSISNESIKLKIGDIFNLTALVTPEDTVDPIAWGSTNSSVASVSQTGEVKAVSAGYATIFAICGDKRVECNVQCGEQLDAPEINIEGTKLIVTSQNPNAKIHTSIKADDHIDIDHENGEAIELKGSYLISSYATAEGMMNSEIATAVLVWIPNDSSGTSLLTSTEYGVIIKSDDNYITIFGTNRGQQITMYSIDGKELYSGKTDDGSTTIPYNAEKGNLYIINISGVSIKYLF